MYGGWLMDDGMVDGMVDGKTLCSREAQRWRMAWRMAQKRANHVLVKRSSEQRHSSRFDPYTLNP